MITGAGNYCGACNGSFMIEKAASTITLNGATKTYNGKAVDGIKATVGGSSGKIKYTYYSDKACKKAINAPKNAGTYFVKATVAADANYLEATSKAATITIKKAANPLKVKVRSLSVKSKEVLAKDKKFTKKQAFVISKAQGTVVFKKVKGDKKVTIGQDGTVTVKKGAKKGKHIIYVNVTAKGNSNYNKGTQKRIKVTVVVK